MEYEMKIFSMMCPISTKAKALKPPFWLYVL